MTDSDLRELDGWIAVYFMKWQPTGWNPITWISPIGDVVCFDSEFKPSSDPAAFALVKREIERREWGWQCTYSIAATPHFIFSIAKVNVKPWIEQAETEELAGCLAVKAAVEGSDARSD